MASQWVDVRDLQFLLHEVFKIGDEILGKGKFAGPRCRHGEHGSGAGSKIHRERNRTHVS